MKDINGKLCTRAEWDALEKDPEQLYIVEDQAGVTLYLGSRPVSSERLTGECEGGMLQAVSQDRATAQLSAASANASAATAVLEIANHAEAQGDWRMGGRKANHRIGGGMGRVPRRPGLVVR
jgi:hypothetical protein